MGTVAEAAQALEAALRGVDGLQVLRDRGASPNPPAAIVNAPALGWQGYCPDLAPTHARFRIDVVVDAGERASEQLWSLIPAVARAIEGVPGAVLAPVEQAATPVTFTTGSTTQLPGYEIQVDYAL